MVWGFLQYAPDQSQGSFCEYIAVKVDECAPVPKNVPIEQVVAASTESLTALQAMRDLGGLSAGKSILILGASGGVGSAAVQIAKSLGAHVTASCSSKDAKRIKGFGADVIVDRSKQDPLSLEAEYDVIFDAPNKYSAVKSMRSLRPNGAYVVTMLTWSLFAAMFLSLFNKKKAKFIECFSKREDLDLIGGWMQEGKLQIDVDRTFPICDLEQAMARQKDKTRVGRVVIQVQGGWKE